MHQKYELCCFSLSDEVWNIFERLYVMMWSPVDEWCQVCVSVSPLFVTLDIISMKKNDKTFHFVPCSLSHIKFIILSYSCEQQQQQLSVAGGNEQGLNWILCHNPLCSICNNEYINLVPAGMRFCGCVRLRPLGSMTWPWRRDWRADNGIHTITYNIIIQPQQNILHFSILFEKAALTAVGSLDWHIEGDIGCTMDTHL